MNKQLKMFIRLFIPPLLIDLVNRLRTQEGEDKEALFDGDDELFKRMMALAVNYAEYGCGESTVWVSENTKTSIHSIDSSRDWINLVRERIGNREASLQWIDCGALGGWGTLLSFEKRNNFKSYAMEVWACNIKPDTVLIDGRFRVYCFLVSLKYAGEGVRIIFDDYTNRPHYHIVEEFVPRSETCGRQCLFIVPPKQNVDFALLDRMIEKFEYVMA
jgi:hypothetical protein